MSAFKADFARYGTDIDVVAVDTGVNDDRVAVETYVQEVGLRMPVAIDDGRLGDALHLKVTPQHVIIGRDGIIRYVGHLEDARLQHELHAAIDDRSPHASALPPSKSGVTPASFPPASGGQSLTAVGGSKVRIDGPSGGATRVLFFFSPWCESYLKRSRPIMSHQCRETRDALSRAAAVGVRVVGIASGLDADRGDVSRFVKETGFPAPIVLDGDGQLFRRFGVRDFPTVIRLDSAGRPQGRLSIGQIDGLSGRPAK